MAVEPGGDAHRVPAARPALAHLERDARPLADRRPERGRLGEQPERVVQHVVGERSGVGAEVGGLHRARSAAGGHREAGAGEFAAEPGGTGVRVGPTGHRVAAHDAHHPGAVEEFVQGVGDGVVVDRAEHRGEDVAVALRALEPGVGARVRGRLVPRVQRLEQFVGRVDEGAVRVEQEPRYGREHQGPGRPDPGGGIGVHRAAEEDGARGVEAEQDVRTAGQIDGLDPEPGERAVFGDHLVELGEGLYLAVVGGAVRLGGCRLHPPMLARMFGLRGQLWMAAGSIHMTSQVWPSRSSKARPYMKPWPGSGRSPCHRPRWPGRPARPPSRGSRRSDRSAPRWSSWRRRSPSW